MKVMFIVVALETADCGCSVGVDRGVDRGDGSGVYAACNSWPLWGGDSDDCVAGVYNGNGGCTSVPEMENMSSLERYVVFKSSPVLC